ncbi:MAG TPA: hypothetical protein PLE81_10780 [Brevundimonas sp.]|uniref:hypothetical protein n=1 Tax=Brevundimonas sp. TaxID=1871086 RepID=UPI002C94CE1B|nr:hypothetical protein [Brevundimonas sp.]HRH21105.1 hypothetical protein [Brevundimonas sp.]
MSLAAYTALSNRGLLPFRDEGRRSGWTSFDEEDVIRLALMIKLSQAGLAQAQAGPLVKAHFRRLVELVESKLNADQHDVDDPLMVGLASRFKAEGGESSEVLVTSLSELAGELRELERGATSYDAFTVVNVSSLMAGLLKRPGNRLNEEMKKWGSFLRAPGSPRYRPEWDQRSPVGPMHRRLTLVGSLPYWISVASAGRRSSSILVAKSSF